MLQKIAGKSNDTMLPNNSQKIQENTIKWYAMLHYDSLFNKKVR